MRIKKYPSGNSYIKTPNGMWVRNLTALNVPFIDINRTVSDDDHFKFIENEFENNLQRYPWIDEENFYFEKAIIVSDGYGFDKKHEILNELDDEVIIIGVNKVLKKWKNKRKINLYVANNPYEECLNYLSSGSKINPTCVFSERTYYGFLQNYTGARMFRYSPTQEESYSGTVSKGRKWYIDDYRNPICASLGLCYRFNIKKIMLFTCSEGFKDFRPGSTNLKEDIWIYPQQKIVNDIIDANMYWMKDAKIDLASYSEACNYENANDIKEENVVEWINS